MMIALIVIGAIWILVFVIISLAGFEGIGVLGFIRAIDVPGSTPLIHMGHYAWEVGKSIWFLVASLPGFIMMFSGIVGYVLESKLENVGNKSEEIKKKPSEMTLEELKAERREKP